MVLSEEEFQRLKQRDPEIVERVYNAYKREIYNYLMVLSNSSTEVAEELFSITIQSALETIHKLRNSKNLFGWFLKIAKNKYYDYLRALYRSKKICREVKEELKEKNPTLTEDPVDRIDEENKLRLLNLAMKKLKPEHREIIQLKYYEGLTHEEIAQRTSKSRDASESLLQRAVASLRKELKRFSIFLNCI